ncbi:polysaccharide biosynthesis/export family protein [Hymenobacter aerilatus]|uniref:Polysaccharide biosynthesis/export family protein n=1 Tax=Hymenobacter aerilatus TaxID=2932251 RepID=A0A8T9SRM9_9BACT|nr:polysaccharide biosynthesis/export family protein [Hymenobacter aerilatus]UOR04475.1 polysaccharide biosynthesis/export family protein [Hymenobacter aerilatus]
MIITLFSNRAYLRLLSFIAVLIAVSGCAADRNLVYFSNLKNSDEFQVPVTSVVSPKIQPDDLLSITVSSLNPESNVLFNNGVIPSTSGNLPATPTRIDNGYLVDANNNINFPVLGLIKLGGLTKEEATTKLTDAIRIHVKNPIVNIRFLNFKITVIGEVTRPASFTIPTERINILEALGLAGDMTAYGKRENVLIIREKDGLRTTTRVNLNDKNILSSPYFYLQQNDIVYVEPDKAKALQVSTRTYYLPIVLTAISVISILFTALK